MRDLASQLRLELATSRPLGGVRQAMARAAGALELVDTGAVRSVTTPAGRAATATGPSLRPQRRRTRRYATRH